MEEIQVSSNEGPRPFPRGIKSEIVKLYWKYLKITGPISTKFGTKHPWADRIETLTNKGPHPSSKGDNSKIIKISGEYLKIFYFSTTGLFNQTWHEAFLGRWNSDFFFK